MSFKVHLFVDLIGKLKDIIDSKKEVDQKESKPCESSVPDEWNELLCEIIILATFTKINKVQFRQSKVASHTDTTLTATGPIEYTGYNIPPRDHLAVYCQKVNFGFDKGNKVKLT